MERTQALNPNAQPWKPIKGAEDDRTIFFTLSKGNPLTKHQICTFFTREYGDCIEWIYVHQPNPRRPPLFGKVVFTKCLIPLLIFGDQEEKHFIIDNKPLWCKKYKNRDERLPNEAEIVNIF